MGKLVKKAIKGAVASIEGPSHILNAGLGKIGLGNDLIPTPLSSKEDLPGLGPLIADPNNIGAGIPSPAAIPEPIAPSSPSLAPAASGRSPVRAPLAGAEDATPTQRARRASGRLRAGGAGKQTLLTGNLGSLGSRGNVFTTLLGG